MSINEEQLRDSGKPGWSDSRKFWMDTARTVVIGLVGTGATVFLINHYTETEKNLISIRMKLRSEAVEGFITFSRKYIIAAGDFCATGKNQDTFESENIDELRTSLARMRAYYDYRADIVDQANDVDKKSKLLHDSCKQGANGLKSAPWRPLKDDVVKASEKLIATGYEEFGK